MPYQVNEMDTVKFEKTFGGINFIVDKQRVCIFGQDMAANIIATDDGGCVITGWTTNFGAGSSDAFILKFDVQGNGTIADN